MNTIDEQAVAAVVGVIVGVTALVRFAFPNIPTRFIPLVTWAVAIVLYMFWTGDTGPDGIKAGILAGLSATGAHAGLRKTLDPDKENSKKIKQLRDRFGKQL